MTSKVSITYPTTKQNNIINTKCPSNVTVSPVTFTGDVTNIIISGNSPRINRQLQLRQNELTVLRIKQPPAPYPVNWSGSGNCSSSGVTYLSAYATDDPSQFKVSPGLPSINDDQSYRSASQKWFDEIGAVKLNMAQIFAERQQTVDLIASTAHRLVDAYRDIRRGRNPFRGRKPTSKRSADAWLEYTYGWVPLVQDVYDAMEFGSISPPSLIVKQRSRVNLQEIKHGLPRSTQTLSSFESFASDSRSKTLQTTIRGRVTVSNTTLSFAQKAGLVNPASLAWELLPYSFVVDWFYPVGPWLERQTALSGITVTDASVTRTARFYSTARVTTTVKSIHQGSVSGGGGGGSSFSQVNKKRTLGVPVLLPPRVKSPISVSHAISALALLRQVFR